MRSPAIHAGEILMEKPDALGALHLGLPVTMPAGANAVRVTTERGRIATIAHPDPRKLPAELLMLKGGGPYKAAVAGTVTFNRAGGFSSTSFEPVHKRIEVKTA